MKISGHKTDSMERRYNIVDAEDLSIAKDLMERRMAETIIQDRTSVTKIVTTTGNRAKPGDTPN